MRAAYTLALLCLTLLLLSLSAWSAEDNSTSDLNGSSNFTDNQTIDADSDGFSLLDDCDDNDPSINPDASETCNAVDDNCDNQTDEGFDLDADSFFPTECTGYTDHDCNDNDAAINPNSTEILGNGLDDDCNALTPDTPYFAVETQAEYYLGEPVGFTLFAPPNATAYVTITTPSPSHNTITSYTGDYPKYEPVPYTRLAGDYTIDVVFEYDQITNATSVAFVVLSTITGTISAPTTIDKGDTASLTATATGGLGALSYYWNFGDGTAAAGASVVHTYAEPGTFTIELEIQDSEGNSWTTTKDILVYDRYAVEVEVKFGDEKINNARVKLFGLEKQTDEDGLVLFKSIPGGTHELRVTKSGYDNHVEDIEVNSNMTKTISLEEEDDQVPSVSLVSPSHQATFTTDEVTVRFQASDNEEMECVLYLSSDNSWWSKEAVFQRLSGSVDESHTLRNLSAGTHWWKVRCQDESANALFSESLRFDVQLSEKEADVSNPRPSDPETEEPQETDEDTALYSRINQILEGIDTLPLEERRAAQFIGLEERLLEVKRDIQTLNRDLFNMRYRDVDDAERDAMRKQIEDDLQRTRDSIVIGIRVIDSTEYVKYLQKEDIEQFSDLLELDISIGKLLKAQSLATVSVSAMVIELEYISGERTKQTVVEKKVSLTDIAGIEDVIEVIPKEVAEFASDLQVEGDYTVLLQDPVLSFRPAESMTIKYGIEKEIPMYSIEETMTVVMAEGQESEVEVTGRTIGALVPVNKTAVLMVLICLLLAGTVVGYFWDSIPVDRFINTESRQARQLASEIRSMLSRQELEAARKRYTDLEAMYKDMPKASKSKHTQNLTDVYHNIRFVELQSLLADMEKQVKDKDMTAIADMHSNASSLYKGLPTHYRRRAFKAYSRIHGKLNEN